MGLNTAGKPLVSVVISSFNDRARLERCVQSVLSSSYDPLEVFVMDQGSTDGGPETVQERFGQDPRLRVICIGELIGLTKTYNRGYVESRGHYIAFMHSDTRVEPDCFTRLVEALESDATIGSVQPKILSMEDPHILQSVGQSFDYLGYPRGPIGKGEVDRGQYDTPRDTFCCWNACMIVRRRVLEEVGPWDPTYHWFREEEDLGWRIRLRGYRNVYIPTARVYHKSSLYLNAYQFNTAYHRFKNYLATLLKNLGMPRLVVIYPLAWMAVILRLFIGELLIMRKPRHVWYALRGIGWFLGNQPYYLRERRRVQREVRRLPDREVLRLFTPPDPRIYLRHIFFLRGMFAPRPGEAPSPKREVRP